VCAGVKASSSWQTNTMACGDGCDMLWWLFALPQQVEIVLFPTRLRWKNRTASHLKLNLSFSDFEEIWRFYYTLLLKSIEMKITPARDPKQCGEGKISTMYVGWTKDDGNIWKRHMFSATKNSYKIVREGPCRELKGSHLQRSKRDSFLGSQRIT
jgi:hypothetical protein